MTERQYRLKPDLAGGDDFGAFFHIVDGGEGDRCAYPSRLDPYGRGCQHDCSYCYAKSLLDFRKLWDAKRPAIADIAAVKKLIPRLRGTVRLGGMTDPFMPLERRVRNTYKVVNALQAAGVPYLIVTKGALVAAPEYLKLFDPALAHVQVTITATSDEGGREYEKATPISARIEAAERLQAAGIDTSIRLSPYLPRLVDPAVLGRIGVDKVCVEFLRVNGWVRKWAHEDLEPYSLTAGGYAHLPLDAKQPLMDGIVALGKETTVCEDVPDHYEHWRATVNPNPDDCCNLRRPAGA